MHPARKRTRKAANIEEWEISRRPVSQTSLTRLTTLGPLQLNLRNMKTRLARKKNCDIISKLTTRRQKDFSTGFSQTVPIFQLMKHYVTNLVRFPFGRHRGKQSFFRRRSRAPLCLDLDPDPEQCLPGTTPTTLAPEAPNAPPALTALLAGPPLSSHPYMRTLHCRDTLPHPSTAQCCRMGNSPPNPCPPCDYVKSEVTHSQQTIRCVGGGGSSDPTKPSGSMPPPPDKLTGGQCYII